MRLVQIPARGGVEEVRINALTGRLISQTTVSPAAERRGGTDRREEAQAPVIVSQRLTAAVLLVLLFLPGLLLVLSEARKA